jgi:hypothetical protein
MLLLLTIHSIVRWLVTLAALALIARLAVGLAKKLPFDAAARGLTAAFGGLMDTQMLLGILYLVVAGMSGQGFPLPRIEHALTMVVAVVVAHLTALWKKQDDAMRTRNTLITVSVALVIVFAGIAPIGGWFRWWHITGLF